MSKSLRVYSTQKIHLTQQEKEQLKEKIQKQVEKYKRDLKCGGVDEYGHFIRLHNR